LNIPRTVTVEAACRAYVEAKKIERGDTPETKRGPAKDADIFFKRDLYGTPFGAIALDKLTVLDCESFRNGLINGTRQKSTVNRIFRAYRAAMNRAWKNDLVMTKPWAKVDELATETQRRKVFLTDEQVTLLLTKAPKDLAALLRGF